MKNTNKPKQDFLDQLKRAEIEIAERSKKISFYTTEYTVELLASKMQRGEYHIPGYQREYNWDSIRKSKFIESLIMGLPIPFLFFWQRDDGPLEIVDGSQRLRTIEEYILGGLTLSNLDGIPSLSKTQFNDLSHSRRLKILNIPIRGIVLNEHADEQARFDMFERINTGSLMANTAEIRRGALRGPFQDMVESLAKTKLLIELAPMTQKSIKERAFEELVARFFAYSDGLENYKDSPSKFIFDYTKAMNTKFTDAPKLAKEYKKRFMRMLEFVESKFPYGFKKLANYKTTPRVRFEAISIGVHFAITQDEDLINQVINTEWLTDAKFEKITTSDAANVKSKIIKRYEFVQNKLLNND